MIFVFGSNLAGRHGKGAALWARQHCAAELGVGEGLTGSAYALPTKDRSLKPLSLEEIRNGLIRLFEVAMSTPEQHYLLTPVGCGEAGYTRQQIWNLLRDCNVPSNIVLASTWITRKQNV